MKVIITAGSAKVEARLNDSATAGAIAKALPIRAKASRWGNEIYFTIPVSMPEEESASDVVPKGAIAYWPPGRALCFFFGPTPASEGDECRAASAVNVAGNIEGSLEGLGDVRDGDPVEVRTA